MVITHFFMQSVMLSKILFANFLSSVPLVSGIAGERKAGYHCYSTSALHCLYAHNFMEAFYFGSSFTICTNCRKKYPFCKQKK